MKMWSTGSGGPMSAGRRDRTALVFRTRTWHRWRRCIRTQLNAQTDAVLRLVSRRHQCHIFLIAQREKIGYGLRSRRRNMILAIAGVSIDSKMAIPLWMPVGSPIPVREFALELFGFGRSGKGAHRGLSSRDYSGYRIEVSRSHEALMFDGGIANALCQTELALLQLRVSRHSRTRIFVCQLKHCQVERVESGERDKLEFVTHLAEFTLEFCDLTVGELGLPIEGWRAVVCQLFVRELCVDCIRKPAGFLQIRLRRFAPDQVCIASVGESAR